MKVKLAKTAGFCMGVDLALTKLDDIIAEGVTGPVFVLGPIIHNPQVLERYAKKGVLIAEKPEEVPDGSRVVIRAHGITRQVEEGLKERGIEIVDATCPKVKKAQKLIGRHTAEKQFLLLYGEDDHPEVRGLVSYAGNGGLVFDDVSLVDEFPFSPDKKYVLAAQTTQDRDQFGALAERLQAREDIDITVLNTICDATKLRQREAMELADESDFVVVVGGYSSGNTRRLAQVVRDQGKPCLHVETADELPEDDLADYSVVGVTAGASTPRDLVMQVIDRLERI
ncbi:4-hydroxy-3-methylbut-2-enyl diphosphate reductase [Salidesulfovibrio brasiliensis]|uniref:4-hydroxy-3-methylbut-2-enyl diphosphate reductase n=1 Tax=Salidesulfovibrio brasiliensis TaxID=221711 RepID=UPI0006D1D023|nr:4-hydroxy-3-methylbut-2-enyl diphosphate reductase [Salidesulfovibrio brasiliensis]